VIKRFLVVLVLIPSCSFSVVPQPGNHQAEDKGKTQAAAALAHAGCGPTEVHFDVKLDKTQHPSPQPDAGKALVFVFEEDETAGEAPTTRVGVDGNWMGANQPASYFFFPVEPGEHHLCTNWQETIDRLSRLGAALNFTAESGKTYYFRTTITAVRDYEIYLESVNSAEGQFLISSDVLSTAQPKKPPADSTQ
jgi:hypothetical protein